MRNQDSVPADTLPSQRSAGVCLHMTSLPGRYGIGEIGDEALRFVDAMKRMNLKVWQFLPTGPTAYGDSPYQPLSTFAGNELLIDTAELSDMVIIDHFRGFKAYWSVPSGAPIAKSGEWVPGPGDAIFIAMEESLGRLPIVAEDLGVITPEVEALRDRHRIPGMTVLQFEVGNEGFDPDGIGANCVCYTGTQDNDTTLGWFRGSRKHIRSRDEIERTRRAALEYTNGRPETIHDDMTELAFSTAALLVH